MTRRIRFSPLLAAGVFAAGLAAPSARASNVPLLPQPVQPGGDANPRLVAADIDRDGDQDVVHLGENADRVGWFENTDGAGAWTFRTISTAVDGPRGLAVADLDRDGDLDVAVASVFDGRISWFANDGSGASWTRHTVSTDAPSWRTLSAGDIDGDGDLDLSYASGLAAPGISIMRWFESTAGATLWIAHDVPTVTSVPYTALPADIDGDGDQDLVSANAWHENLLGNGSIWTAHTLSVIPPIVAFHKQAADMDRDGDLDLAYGSTGAPGSVGWLENVAGNGTSWTRHDVGTPVHDAITSVAARDLDGDGDLDLAFGEGFIDIHRLGWIENTGGGDASWITRTVSTLSGPSTTALVDLDGDGDLDLMAASNTTALAWYRNATIHQNACFVPRTISTAVNGAQAVVPADVDGDGDTDAVSTAFLAGAVLWHDNTAGDASAWTTRTIATGFPSAVVAAAGDVDGDGDVDVAAIGAPIGAGTLAWFANTAGNGSAWTQSTVSTAFNRATHVELTDVSGDGDLDLLGAGYYSSTLLFENAAGSGSAWSTITLPAPIQTGLATGDLDRDGDLDVTSTESFFGDGLSWSRNVLGDGTFWSQQTIATTFGATYAMATADIDGDGDLDVLHPGANFLVGNAIWYENVGGTAGSWTPHHIPGAESTIAAVGDLDRDGDVDVIAPGTTSDLRFWENTDGTGLAWSQHLIAPVGGTPRQLDVADLDRDGDPDVVSATASTNAVNWYENRGGQASITVANQAPPTANNGELVSMLRATVTHLGRAEDFPIELASLGLLFEEAPGDPLTSAEANALVESLRVYRDANGSGVFEPATDVLVTSVPTLALTAGVATVGFADGDPNLEIAFGVPRTYFVVAELTATASGQAPNQFRVTLLQTGASRSSVEDLGFDIPLRLACPADVSSSIRQVVPVELTGFAVE
jgi:FG-GAP-like repeat